MPTRLSSLAVQIEAIGVDKVKSALREVGGEAETQSRRLKLISGGAADAADKYGGLTRSVAKFTDEIAESGKVSGRNLRSLIGEVGSLGFAFGPYGELVAGVAIGGAAIYHLFARTRDEMEKTQKQFKDSLAQMINAGDAIGLEKQLRDLYRGTPANDFKDAVKPKLDKMAELKEYRSALGEGKIWLGMGAKKAYEELANDPDVIKYYQLVQAIKDPANAPLPDIGLSTVTIHGKAAPTDESIEAALAKRIDILSKGLIFDDQRARITRELTQLEKQLKAAVDSGTLSVEARARAALHLADVESALARKFVAPGSITSPGQLIGITGNGETAGRRAQEAYGGPMKNVAPRPDDLIQAQIGKDSAWAQQFKGAEASIANTIRSGFAQTLGDAIYQGFSAAFHGKGLGWIFKAFGKTVLAGIGQTFTQLGQVYLEYGGIMSALATLLPNPFTAGAAGLAIGAALIAMGTALGAVGSGRGGGGGAGNFTARVAEVTQVKLVATSVADAARMEPRTPVHQTIIGPGDPVAFRQIQQGLDNHARR